MCVEVIVCYISVVFLRHSVEVFSPFTEFIVNCIDASYVFKKNCSQFMSTIFRKQ